MQGQTMMTIHIRQVARVLQSLPPLTAEILAMGTVKDKVVATAKTGAATREKAHGGGGLRTIHL